VSDAAGNYSFGSAPTLPSGYVYVVVYQQNSSCNLWNEWDSSWIYPYAAGQSRHGGDFDIGDITRIAPGGNVAGTSQSFAWSFRPLPAGSLQYLPQVEVLDSTATNLLYRSAPLARGATNSPPVSGFVVANSYTWTVIGYGSEGAGFPLCVRTFTVVSAAPPLGSLGGEQMLPARRGELYPPTLNINPQPSIVTGVLK
jgi:hypothetical protein